MFGKMILETLLEYHSVNKQAKHFMVRNIFNALTLALASEL